MGGNVTLTGKSVTDRTVVKEIEVDVSGSLIGITHQHSQVHQGQFYTASHYFSAVASAGVRYVRLLTPAGLTAHSVIRVAAGADAKVEVLEGTTYSANGTEVTPYNHNRSSSNTSSCTAYHTPTVDVEGTVILTDFLPGGIGGGSIGSSAEVEAEQFVFAANTDYLIKVTNNGATTEDICIQISYYEV